MFHVFELEKSVQAAGVLLRAHHGKQMSSLRLLTLLYLADRENLKAVARPILGTSVIAKEEGPQHREVWDLLFGEHAEESAWSPYIQKDGYVIELIEDPSILDLSAQEIQTLNAVAHRCRDQSDLELVEQAREFPEWRKNRIADTTRPIPIGDILDALGWSSEDKSAILEEFDDEERLERLLERNPAAA